MLKSKFRFLFGLLGITLLSALQSYAQEGADLIRVNQIGFYPNSEKVAVVVDTLGGKYFYLLSNDAQRDTVYQGKLSKAAKWEYSDEYVRKADFSDYSKKGNYVLFVPKVGSSHPFQIGENVLGDISKASLKAYYYQRTAIDLDSKYAGKWARKAGHPDDKVIVHNSAAFGTRKAGDLIKSSKGWYDAGDYNKYIVNSGITMYTLLSAYEDYSFYFDTLKLNIPETGNKLPDILDETLWNLRWMLTMQDPQDGGVYHKLTNAGWDGPIQPEAATKPRYVVKKSTNAALDFAAVMAQASRVFGKFRKQLPGLADSCLKASIKAYGWAKINNNVPYIQSELNDPTVVTGAYDDFKFSDELLWASLELFVTTGKIEYYEESNIDGLINGTIIVSNWQDVAELGLYTLAKNSGKFKGDSKYEDINFEAVTKRILKIAKMYKNHKGESAYGVPMGNEYGDFAWGSNAIAANEGFLLLQAFLLSGDKGYLEAAGASLDYLLGRNATTYSFVTGYGEKSSRDPHHRPSESDGIDDPIPGLLTGGPNPGQQDKGSCGSKAYPSELPAKSYIDKRCSYASNEIAINWNAPFAYLSNGLQAIRSGNYATLNK